MRRFFLGAIVVAVVCTALPVLAQKCPTVVVIIPETVTISRIPRQVPDPAAETAIIHLFIDYGFHVVDQVQVAFIRYEQLVKDGLAGDAAALLQLSERFSADILVLGEAFAEETESRGTFQSARARVELRAVESSTGRILAAEALHTGGMDLTVNAAAKKALERAGDGIACQVARKIAASMPRACTVHVPKTCVTRTKVGVSPFDNQSPLRMSGIGELFATKVSTALSEHGCGTVQLMAADAVVSGVITDWNQVLTPAIPIPGLDWLIRAGTMWMTVDVQVFDLRTSKLTAFEVRDQVSGIEIFGIRLGFNPGDLVGRLARSIAEHLENLCSGG